MEAALYLGTQSPAEVFVLLKLGRTDDVLRPGTETPETGMPEAPPPAHLQAYARLSPG